MFIEDTTIKIKSKDNQNRNKNPQIFLVEMASF